MRQEVVVEALVLLWLLEGYLSDQLGQAVQPFFVIFVIKANVFFFEILVENVLTHIFAFFVRISLRVLILLLRLL